MIQRKQTLILAVSVILFIVFLVMPYARFSYKDVAECSIGVLGLSGLPYTEVNYLFFIATALTTLCIALEGIAIFLYKKRALQVRLCAFASLSNILLIGFIFLIAEILSRKLNLTEPFNYTLTAYIPIVNLILISLAQRFIRKDEALVKSLNRLR